MKRLILATLTAVSCALPLVAQNKTESKRPLCSLSIEQAPELRGFRLGMSQSAVLTRFPGTSLGKPNQLGISQMRLTIIDTSSTARNAPRADKGVQPDMMIGDESAFILDAGRFPVLKGVRRVRLEFTDGRLSSAAVAYDDAIKWDNVDTFVETVAKALNLPTTWYLPSDAEGTDRARELSCGSFMITADVGSDAGDSHIAAQLTIEDQSASKLVEKRQNDLKEKAQRDEEAKRKNFKP